MVTMGDVALRAGVSQATVSFVLGGRADRLKISPETRERVLGAARELGYQRNQLARAMVTGKSRILGFLTTPQANDNIVRIMTGAMEVASENNYLLKIVHLSWAGIDNNTIARCVEWRLAGAIIIGFSDETHRRIFEAFRESKLPLALVDNVPQISWGARIGSDDEQGIGQVIAHLLALGHRKIAYIGGRPSPLSEWREQSFRAALTHAGLTVPAHWVRSASWNDAEIIEAQVQGLFTDCGDRLPTAVVCSADTIAMTVHRIARARGLRLPDDLSVTGYSNAMLSAFTDPPLTTVDQSFHEMGRAAASQLIGVAESEEEVPPRNTLLPTRLIVRSSTAIAPAS